MFFTGYLPRRVSNERTIRKTRKKFCVKENNKMVVVTAGGGGDGFKMMDTYLAMHEQHAVKGVTSLLITGPFMPKEQRRHLAKRAKSFPIKVLPFYPRMEEVFGAADLVVSMGGYNTICEVMSQATPLLIIPRETPRKEQLLRAQALKKKDLIDFIPRSELKAGKLYKKMYAMLDDLETFQKTISGFKLDGIRFIKSRLDRFRESRP